MEQSASEARDSVIQMPDTQAINTGYTSGTETEDHFILRNGKEFAGTHLILELWEASNLDNLQHMESAMREAVTVSGATAGIAGISSPRWAARTAVKAWVAA